MGPVVNHEVCETNRALEKKKAEEYKQWRREQRIHNFLYCLKWLTVGFIIGIIISIFSGCGTIDSNSVVHTDSDVLPADEQVIEKSADTTKPPVTEDVAKDVTEDVTEVPETTEVNDAPVEHEQTSSTWHTSSKTHDVNVNTIITYEGGSIWNFSNTVAVGMSLSSDIVSTTETDYGFVVSVIDNDAILVHIYNNSAEQVVPVALNAEISTGDYHTTETKTDYVIKGYADSNGGLGVITVTFSNEKTAKAGILKEDGVLYAANITENNSIAQRVVGNRLAMEPILDEYGITPETALFTDPIYYPIAPVANGETTDTAYWVQMSSELVEPDWTDAHKIAAFYNYCIDNFAYDHWVLGQGKQARCFLYKDYTGKYYISNTHIGVCEDFAQVIAIMCRAQNIPAVVAGNDHHAWDYVYVADYNRWIAIDVTNDLQWNVYDEDMTNWKYQTCTRYQKLDNVGSVPTSAGIGNADDMAKQNITY